MDPAAGFLSANPLTKPMLICCQLDLMEDILREFLFNTQNSSLKNAFEGVT